jgi:hypothetical protein
VPLKALLKLDRNSHLLWAADVAAHHDLALGENGEVHVLTEEPRVIQAGGLSRLILDNVVTVLDGEAGTVRRAFSLFDILRTDPAAAALIDCELERRYAAFERSNWPTVDGGLDEATIRHVHRMFETGQYSGELRNALRLLRQLPESPCDILHTNTLEILEAHPRGLWRQGNLLISMRSINLIAAIDLDGGRTVWSWGADHLAGQHQPSMTPQGTVLVFDNGATVGRSRIVEVDPVDGRITWLYAADPPEKFFTALAGGCELLPDGNVLVSEAQAGRAFEVTRAGETAWDWSIPAPPPGSGSGRATFYRLAAVRESTMNSLLAGRP